MRKNNGGMWMILYSLIAIVMRSTLVACSAMHLLTHFVGTLDFIAQHSQPSTKSRKVLIKRNAERILRESVCAYFSRKTPAATVAVDRPPWKRHGVVAIFRFTLHNTRHPDFAPIQHLVFPAVLTLIDDYQPEYKLAGVRLARHIAENSREMDLRASGFGQVLFEALLPLLTYNEQPDLVSEALEGLVQLIPMIEVRNSEPYHAKVERLAESILRGLAFAVVGSVAIIRAFLRAIPGVASMMGILTIKWLQPFLGASCDILRLHQGDLPTQILAARSVEAVVQEGWPRINAYRGIILRSVAETWKTIHAEEPSSEISDLTAILKKICVLLKEACVSADIDRDYDLLRLMDAQLYGLLLEDV
ncbi:hypothetical protein BC832DRAFT_122207 [Gaertneriomyces semiglobifer]|nr:hypothetical protein BC832DRAFT_247373 [Gaertneriomyces semiglobifer]KAI9002432.1 hypothetical protein BC832DRAFT_122207 [Gaertneriomyces semiglobifer]